MITKPTSRTGFTIAELVVCTAIAGMAFVFAAPTLNKGREGADRLRCENNLRMLSQAQLMYANDHGGFPPMALSFTNADYTQTQPGPGGWYDGHGWYSLVAPYIGEPEWAATIDLSRSMSDVRNAAARRGGLRLKIHVCPAGPGPQREEWASNNWARVLSNYVVNAGNTNYGQLPLNGVPFLGAPFAGGKITPLATITDGLPNTLMMSEVLVLGEVSTWGGPYSDTQTALGGQVFTGFNPPNSADLHDGIAYGRTGNLGESAANLRYIAGGFTTANWPVAISSPSGPYGTYIAARSKHVGGVNASLCDGSAGFIVDGIDPAVWRALSTARGGDYVPPTQIVATGLKK